MADVKSIAETLVGLTVKEGQIEGRVNGVKIVILTQFVKKS